MNISYERKMYSCTVNKMYAHELKNIGHVFKAALPVTFLLEQTSRINGKIQPTKAGF